MKRFAVALAIVGLVATAASAATVKLRIVPMGHDPTEGDAQPVPVVAVDGLVAYEVYAEVIGDDNGGLAFFSVDIETDTGLQQPVIGPNGEGAFSSTVQQYFSLGGWGPWEGWPEVSGDADDLLEVAGVQNVFGTDPASSNDDPQPCDPATLLGGFGQDGPVLLFSGIIDCTGLTPTPDNPLTVVLVGDDDPATGSRALVWKPFTDIAELCDLTDPNLYPTVLEADVEVNMGLQIVGTGSFFDDLASQNEPPCTDFTDFLGFTVCWTGDRADPNYTYMQVGCEVHDQDRDGDVDFTDFLGFTVEWDGFCP